MPSLDVVALEAALPAELVTAVTSDPHGIDAVANVYVARSPRTADKTNPEAWFLPQPVVAEPTALGAGRSAFAYRLTFEGSILGLTNLQRLSEQARQHFHNFKRPAAIAGLRYVEVADTILDVHERDGTALAAAVTLIFHGED